MRRRDVLLGAAGAGLVSALPLHAFAQSSGIRTTMLSPDMALIEGAGGNVLAVSDGASVTLVDAGAAEHVEALIAAIGAAFPGQSVSTLINTHWHPDQTGGNAAFRAQGASIVAHANTRLWLTTDVTWPATSGQEGRGPVGPAPAEAWPTEITYYDPQTRGSGAAQAEYGYLFQAHTDGDLYVKFPQANVIHVGGALSADRWSDIDWWTGGWLGGVVEAAETLLQISGDDTRFVASDGPVFTRAELAQQAEMYATLFLRFRDELMFTGLSPAEAVAERPTAEFHPEWGDPEPFVITAFQSLWHYFAPEV